MTTLLIRADATAQIGTGHVMRCLALAQAWKKLGDQAVFLMRREGETLETRIRSAGVAVRYLNAIAGSKEDAQETARLTFEMGASWIILDGYHFSSAYQGILKDFGSRLLYIDDYGHLDHYPANIVLNHNLGSSEALYPSRAHDTQLMLGSDYILLRQEFLKWKKWERKVPKVARKILVSFGGGDSGNTVFMIIKSLQDLSLKDVEVVLLTATINPQTALLQKEITVLPFRTRLLHTTHDMAEIMAWADIAISAAGSTAWELAYMGVPSILVVLAENQMSVARELDNRRIGLNLGGLHALTSRQITSEMEKLLLSEQERSEMSYRGRKLLDGYGVDRIIHKMRGPVIQLRRVEEGDCQLIWEWANDKTLREVSFSQTPIVWKQHLIWFHEKLQDSNCHFYICLDEGKRPIGQVRFNLKGGEAIISVGVDKRFRGKGYGTALIELSSHELQRTQEASIVHAYVKSNNEKSIRAFLKAGFINAGKVEIKEHNAVHLMLQTERGKAT
jgi:UDP-2,4-diacetamido-2,4,6-trideoxy-beta-L-altropyranose hydrolase